VHALNERAAAPANVAEMDPKFVEQFGAPANEQILVLPLVLKDKVAALVYADGGEHSEMDSAALELLVAATSSWLEVASLRKQAQKENAPEAGAQEREPAPVPVQAVSSFPDPFAGTSPSHVAASIPAAPEPAPVPAAPNERVEDDRVEEVVEVASLTQSAAAGAASAPAAATDPFAGISPEDADTHRKAQRFARLLVDEIKLYNQAKVAEGRRHKDVYDRLKDDIDKSHSTYQKRYGKTAAASGEYFQQELVRSLAEDDATLMGANFRK
jgi:hypothetical protein